MYNKIGMGDNSGHNDNRYKQFQRNRLDFFSVSDSLVSGGYKGVKNMEIGKMVITIFNIIGIPLYVYAWIINLDNIKGWILTGIGIAYGLARLYFYVRKSSDSRLKDAQERVLRDLEIKGKHIEMMERESDALERQLSLRITGLTPAERRSKES